MYGTIFLTSIYATLFKIDVLLFCCHHYLSENEVIREL